MYDVRSQTLVVEAGDKRIVGTLHLPADGRERRPLIIKLHGFGRNHHPQDPMALAFARAGYAVYAFDFCGGVESRSSGDPLERSVLTEAADTNDVIDALLTRPDVDLQRLCLLGHSEGGFVAAYVAAQRPLDVKALVMYFPAFVLQDEARERAAADGSFPATSQVMGVTIGRAYNVDATSFDIYREIGAFRGKVLIMHGDADRIVPLAYSQRAVVCYEDAQLVVMPGQGHGFRGGGGPEAVETTLAFLADAMG